MPFIRTISTKPGECCECECEKRDGPCDCCDCCPDVDLPDDICVYCIGTGEVTNTAGCCTQKYTYCKDVQAGVLQPDSCEYKNAGGDVILYYDSVAGFWKGSFCGAEIMPIAGGCEHVLGEYFSAGGVKTGGVIAKGDALPAEQWLFGQGNASCVSKDGLDCECPDPVGDDWTYGTGYGEDYEELEGCMDETADNYSSEATTPCADCCCHEDEGKDPCCYAENRKLPSEEGVAFNPANEVCP